jgi:hypothetical protein
MFAFALKQAATQLSAHPTPFSSYAGSGRLQPSSPHHSDPPARSQARPQKPIQAQTPAVASVHDGHDQDTAAAGYPWRACQRSLGLRA